MFVLPQFLQRFLQACPFFHFSHGALSQTCMTGTRAPKLNCLKRFNAVRTVWSPGALLTCRTAKTLRCSIGSFETDARPCLRNCFWSLKQLPQHSCHRPPHETRFEFHARSLVSPSFATVSLHFATSFSWRRSSGVA